MNTQLLDIAFAEAAKLSEEDQNSFASWVLAELQSERRWTELFASSPEKLGRMAEEALREYAAGDTEELDLSSL